MDGAPHIDRLRIRVRGRVQGVGFRPFVHRLAQAHGVSGWVRNDAEGVLIEVEGDRARAFLAELTERAPPLARIRRVEVESRSPNGMTGFSIVKTRSTGPIAAAIPPDMALCDDCLRELFSPLDRREGHPFVTCTNCGPRFTITHALPYDRAQTSMAGFAMCPACTTEYADPFDRRHHAEPIACPDCGPSLTMEVPEIVARLRAGEIVALKGIGGFHLAVDARNAAAVHELRKRKSRPGKPLAVMVANLASAQVIAEVSDAEAAAVSDPARPILVLRDRGVLPEVVSDGLPTLGLMLAYTPLHWLILHEAAGRPNGTDWLSAPQDFVLVMTSANPSGEPLVLDDLEAETRLSGIVDTVAGHNRDIVARCDDSVQKVVAGAPVFLRRGRGYVPDLMPLVTAGPPVLALGALLKCAPCLTRENEAALGQHVGDLTSAATIRFLREAADHLRDLLQVSPVAVSCDLHPDYPSSRLSEAYDLPVIRVQHHHAHLAAVAAEYGIEDPLTGLVLDGFGLGGDGTLWGGELLRMEGASCERLGHLAPLPLPGGDCAAREPWRMAAAALHAIERSEEIAARFTDRPGDLVARMLVTNTNCPQTTSAGRLFDAAAGLLGLRYDNRFEGEAAMALESACRQPCSLQGGWQLRDGVLSFTPLLEALADCRDPVRGADMFHGTLSDGLSALVAARAPLDRRIALTGGCCLNRPLVETLIDKLSHRGVEVLLPRAAPPGDGGLALGQVLIARRTLKETL